MKLILGQKLGKPECPYIKRWVLDLGFASIRLHHWLSSDDQRHYHDHPWWYASLLLRGSYIDKSPGIARVRRAGDLSFYPASHQHTVKVMPGGCWSVLLTGPEKRDWGFWVNGKFRKRNKYFFMFGEHPCE